MKHLNESFLEFTFKLSDNIPDKIEKIFLQSDANEIEKTSVLENLETN